MAAAYDFKSDENGDLYINPITGDFEIGPSDEQHIQDIIESFAGHWKESPSVGVGIDLYLKGTGTLQAIEAAILLQLTKDGYQAAPRASLDPDGKLIIVTNATRN